MNTQKLIDWGKDMLKRARTLEDSEFDRRQLDLEIKI